METSFATVEKRHGLGNQQASHFHHAVNGHMMMWKLQRLAERRRAKRPEMRGLYVPAARPIAVRFAEKVRKHRNGCHEWTGSIIPGGPRTIGGYGLIHRDGRTVYAHRVAWELVNGSIPRGTKVLHTCDNRRCVNIAHLYLGSHQDNMDDMMQKLRQPHGPRNGHAKLTIAEVHAIRAATGTHDEIAASFDVSRSLISLIRARRIWKYV